MTLLSGSYRVMSGLLLSLCLLLPLTRLTASFDLEGSSTSYAQFRKWYVAQNGSLSMEIQTKDPNGLLLYTDDGGSSDFFELKLVEGYLRLRYLLAGRSDVIAVRRNLQDSHWHRLEVIRNLEETSLRVDDETQSKVARGNFASFGANFSSNGFVYVGGIPSLYGSKLGNLSLPSVFYEPHFRGSVQNVAFASEEGQPSRRQDMIGFMGVRSNKLDACEHHVPCQHAGTCISTDSGATCNCRDVDYDGTYCENEKPSAEATFRGSEYLSYDPKMKAPIIGSSDQASLYFKTRQPSGMLFYTGDNDDYMMLSLRDGVIVLTVSLGAGSVEKAVRPARVRFDDNQWHKVLVHRKVREITKAAGFCHFSITVDGVYTQRGSTAGTFSLLSSNVLFVGGSDRTNSNVGAKIRRNFVGCLRKVEFAADSLSFGLIEMARTGNKLIRANGNVKFMCQEVEAADPVTFTTRESFLALPSWQATRSGSVSFKIRTNEPNGVLMYNSGANSQGDFFAFELLDGHIFLLLNFGSGSEKVKVTTRKVDDGHWHAISLRRTGKSGRVTVDESAVDFNTPGNSNQLDLEGPLYLGGIAATAEKATIPSDLWTGLLGYGYIGCMRDLVVNTKAIDIAAHAEKQDSGSIRPACHTAPPQCDSQPCLNGGQCSEGWNRFICECVSTSFSGTVCAKDATTLSFDGEQYMKIFLQEGSQTQAENIKLRFRTTRPNGLILVTLSEKTSNYLVIALDSGRVRVTYSLGDGSKAAHIGQGLNDDQWHVFLLQRRGQFVEIKVDSEMQTMELSGQYLTLDINTIHIGAVTAERSNSASATNPTKDLSSFVGHMQHLEMNSNNYFDMARTGQMSNFQVTAKFGKKDQIVHHPVTFKSKYTFIGMAQLKAYSSMNLYFQFKTLEANGVILYNAGKGQDFIAIEMVNGHLHYLFNLGDGPRKVRSNTRNTLNDNRWHAVTIGRTTLRQHTLMVDDMIATVSSTGPNVHLDLDGLLYLGGVRRSMYGTLPKLIQSRHGFEGCLASLDLNSEMLDPTKDAVIPSTLVSKGCAGPVTKCSNTACANRGVCVQMWNSYTCDCDMTSYTGPTCSDESIGYKFGPETGLITLTYPPDKRPDTKSDLLALAFYTHSENAVLVRVDSGSSNDYMELEIVDGNVFMVYNMGTEDHPIGEMSVRVNDGHYHVVRFTRSGPNSTIQVDDHNVRTKHPKGRQLTIFNSHSKIQVGGKKNPIRGKIERAFKGVITGLVFNGHRLLDMAAEDDPRVSLEGDVELLMQIPSDLMQKNLSPSMQQHQRAPVSSIVDTDELIHSGFGSGGCDDDEDDCGVVEPGSGDELITPVYIPPTPKPRPTHPPPPRQLSTHRPPNVDRDNRNCDDEEDCIDGSGSGEQLPPSPTEIIKPEVIQVVTTMHLPDYKPSPAPTRPAPNPYSEVNNREGNYVGREFTRRPAYVTTPRPLVSTSRKPPQVYWVPNPDVSAKEKESQKPSANTKNNPADNTALVIGIIAGIIIAIVLIALVVYIVRNRTVGSYKVDESKNYQFSAVTNSAPPVMTGGQQGGAPPPQGAQPPQQMNGSAKPMDNKANKLPKKKDVKDLKEWYV